VGVIEEYEGGTGASMRASSWIAAFIASQTLGARLVDHEFSVRSSGMVDGPSASLLIGATMMALMRDKKPRADTTMTGALLPDGSSGPVGGIVQKMRGAKAAGIKRFGYPMGERQHQDLVTGEVVDLEALGQELGMQTRELHDIQEAYTWLTDDTLPEAKAASEADMALDPSLVVRLKQRNAAMEAAGLQRVKAASHNIKKADARVAQGLLPMAGLMVQSNERAERFKEQGQYEASYGRTARAMMLAGALNSQLLLLDAITKSNWAQVRRQVQELKRSGEGLAPLMAQIEERMVQRTLGGRINAIYALITYVTATAFAQRGAELLAVGEALADGLASGKLPATERNVTAMLGGMVLPTIYVAATEALIYAARLQLALGTEEGSVKADGAQVASMAQAYRSAASANMAYFNALLLKDMAEREGISHEQAADSFAAQELSYGLARTMASQSIGSGQGGGGQVRDMVGLATGGYSYITSSELIFKYYSLQGRRDANGDLKLGKRGALSAHLDQSRQRAREAAGRCKQRVGFIPSAARVDYSAGLALRDGDDEDKLEALSSFWMSAFWSDLAGALN
jgi:hypothetical protein